MPNAFRDESAGGLDDLLDRFLPIGDWGCEPDAGEGISGIEPCGDPPVLERLWVSLRLDNISILELPAERGDNGADRPRSDPFPLSLGLDPLTSPRASLVIILCSSANLRDNASSSSAVRSASSSLIASSSEESTSPGDDGEVGRRGAKDLFVACTVNVEDDVTFFGRGEPFPSELSRARTPSGDTSFVLDELLLASIRPAIVGGFTSGKSKFLGVWATGLRAPWIT